MWYHTFNCNIHSLWECIYLLMNVIVFCRRIIITCSLFIILLFFQVWGCAYRSLQTLVSWFLLQMYTSKAPPTHLQIQQALVDVKDKEPSLVGSKEWIGSFEVSTCLDHFLGVGFFSLLSLSLSLPFSLHSLARSLSSLTHTHRYSARSTITTLVLRWPM